jgi:hypothetical protein
MVLLRSVGAEVWVRVSVFILGDHGAWFGAGRWRRSIVDIGKRAGDVDDRRVAC